MLQIIATKRFAKSVLRLTAKNENFKTHLEKALRQIRLDIKHPSLRLHKIKGREIWSFTVTMGIRILAVIEKDIVILTDIGSHTIYQKLE